MGMDVLYTANDKYIDIMLTSMVSLIRNGGFQDITFHIITENYSYEDYKRVYDVLTRYDNVDLFFYNLEDYNIERFNIPKWRNTQIANARVFYNRILDKNPKGEQILYLDSDTLVVDKIDVIRGNEDNPIYAVQDSTRKEYYHNLGLSDYYNSGVLLFNRDTWNEKKIDDRIFTFLENHDVTNFEFPDQDLINISLQDEIGRMPLGYNICIYPFMFNEAQFNLYYGNDLRSFSLQEIDEARKNAKIIHFYGINCNKPWFKNKINPFNETYREYLHEVNPDFEIKPVPGIAGVLANSPILFYNLLALRSNMKEDTVKRIKQRYLK